MEKSKEKSGARFLQNSFIIVIEIVIQVISPAHNFFCYECGKPETEYGKCEKREGDDERGSLDPGTAEDEGHVVDVAFSKVI